MSFSPRVLFDDSFAEVMPVPETPVVRRAGGFLFFPANAPAPAQDTQHKWVPFGEARDYETVSSLPPVGVFARHRHLIMRKVEV